MSEIVGYFYWAKTLKGAPSPVKLDAALADGMMDITKKEHEESIVPGSKRTLDTTQWSLSLNQLAVLYPCGDVA